jgi:energy-coupling factor transport system ATP-binding protein
MDEIIFDVANRCGITHLLNKSPSSMSGGEKQKGNLAGILALNPKILILDEAYNMLDGQSKKEMKSMIANMRENGKTIISITHDSEELLLADYIVLLDNGKIVFSGTKEELFEFDVTQYNVELPYIMQLEKAMGYTSFISEEVFLNKVGETL